MGFIGDLAKAILISWVVFWISAMIWFIATRQIGIALLFLVGLLIPLSMIAYEYRKYRKRSNQHILSKAINNFKYPSTLAHTEFKRDK